MSEAVVGCVRLYGCGGGGSNTARRFLDHSKQAPEKNFASLHPVLIDTSRSNMGPGVDDSNSYILKDLDGSGMLRRENYTAIDNVVKEILHMHRPLDLNVVVFTAAGGSGSVIGPLIINELLSRNAPVIAVVIGGDESAIATQNSLNTLKTLDGISANHNKPIVTYYRQNLRGTPRHETDSDIDLAIMAIAILASRQIRELDSQDIFNFLNYQRVTSVPARVAGLDIYGRDNGGIDKNKPVSVISIRPNPDETSFEHIPGFLKAAYADINIAGTDRLFFAVDVNQPSRWGEALQKTLNQIQQTIDARPAASRLISDDDQKTDKGFVL